MADAWPPSLKPLGKYLARAAETESTNPIVSFYCNLYATKEGLRIHDKEDTRAKIFVSGMLEKCETRKKEIGPDNGTHKHEVERYALEVFEAAEADLVLGNATQATARTFYSAMCFMDVCRVFGPLSPEIEVRHKFAKHQAGTITKAIREGRDPNLPEDEPRKEQQDSTYEAQPSRAYASEDHPQPARGSEAPQLAATPPASSMPLGAIGAPHDIEYPGRPHVPDNERVTLSAGGEISPSNNFPGPYRTSLEKHNQPAEVEPSRHAYHPTHVPASNPYVLNQPYTPSNGNMGSPTYTQTEPAIPTHLAAGSAPSKSDPLQPLSMPTPVDTVNRGGYEPTFEQVEKAQKLAKEAVSALDFNDTPGAVGCLEHALSLLRGAP